MNNMLHTIRYIILSMARHVYIAFGLPVYRQFVLQCDHKQLFKIDSSSGSILSTGYCASGRSHFMHCNQIIGPVKRAHHIDVYIPVHKFDEYYNHSVTLLRNELNMNLDMVVGSHWPKYIGLKKCKLGDLLGFYVIDKGKMDEHEPNIYGITNSGYLENTNI